MPLKDFSYLSKNNYCIFHHIVLLLYTHFYKIQYLYFSMNCKKTYKVSQHGPFFPVRSTQNVDKELTIVSYQTVFNGNFAHNDWFW